MLTENVPMIGDEADPFFNLIPLDENDIYQKRVSDVVLTPLKVRAKREIMLEEREKINSELLVRNRRQVRGRFRGQTQSQYMNLGQSGDKEGKAEAEATDQSSRAVVSEF